MFPEQGSDQSGNRGGVRAELDRYAPRRHVSLIAAERCDLHERMSGAQPVHEIADVLAGACTFREVLIRAGSRVHYQRALERHLRDLRRSTSR